VVKLAYSSTPSTLEDLPASIILGAIGGLLGAGFIFVNQKVGDFRKKVLKTKFLKVLESIILITITATVFFFAPLIFNNDCQTIP
jgi:H+/Cl- antiporter ClcA